MRKIKDYLIWERPYLFSEDLDALIQGKILALRINPFISKEIINETMNRLMFHEHQIHHYSMAEDVGVKRLGMTIFETENKQEKLREYHKLARNSAERLRAITAPTVNPLDLLRLRLMEAWRWGLKVEWALGEPMNPGIVRYFEQGDSDGLPPHQDLLSRDLPNNHRAKEVEVQLAANIFIKVPQEGGEIEIWDHEPNLVQFEALKEERYDFIDREKIPGEGIKIKPQEGELMLFRSSCVHAVLPSKSSTRIAYSCSVGYFGMGKSLSVWA
ncbi:MAG: 2OG-Fe(II) oxygenase [Bacteroidia bacterium]|nr:2OG-Fe(II) oxygenase [Bacteroidia bacterium]